MRGKLTGQRVPPVPVVTPTDRNFQTGARNAAASANVQSAAVGTIESRLLAPKVLRANHPVHGELTISREEKSEQQNELTFKLHLVKPNGDTFEDSHTMYVTRSARNYRNESAVGYNYIDLDEEFQGKGVGYVLHAAAAEAAKELDARLLVIDDVSTDAMRAFCVRTGMTANCDSYSLSPMLAEEVFTQKAFARGWTMFERGSTG